MQAPESSPGSFKTRTVDFYSNTLGLSLLKTIELPGGGQHFFFDIGNGDALAFFWFPQAPEVAPGIASVRPDAFQTGNIVTAHGSMNHVSFNIPVEKVEEYRAKLVANGILLEFAANVRKLGDPVRDLQHQPAIAAKS